MENSRSWDQKTLISELIEGKELTKQLRHNLHPKCSLETRNFLMQEIVFKYENALLILKSNTGSVVVKPTQTLSVTTSFPISPISVDGSDDFDRALQNGYKKRKVLSRWTNQVITGSENGLEGHTDDGYRWRKYGQKNILEAKYPRKVLSRWTNQVITGSENGLEGHTDDGYRWRKYGQKNILEAKYPRSYYRCTFLKTQGCLATKQVQRSDADPSLFVITYRGKHTCTQVCTNSAQPPPSPDNKEQKPSNHNEIPKQQQFEQSIQNFPNNWNLEVGKVEPKDKLETLFSFPSTSYGCMKGEDGFSTMVFDNEALLGSFCESLISPITPDPNNNMVSPFEMNYVVEGSHKVHCFTSNLTEIVSANTSAANSSVSQLDFCTDPIHDVSYFPI